MIGRAKLAQVTKRVGLHRARYALRRVASIMLTAMAFGFGGGLGGLGSGTHRVGRPERDNPIVCLAEHVSERR